MSARRGRSPWRAGECPPAPVRLPVAARGARRGPRRGGRGGRQTARSPACKLTPLLAPPRPPLIAPGRSHIALGPFLAAQAYCKPWV
jgi:hypothetical protein